MLLSVLDILRTHRFRFTREAELQEAIFALLTAANIDFARECILTPTDRIDFLVGGLGIEVKIDGSLAALTRQAHRYTALPSIESLLVVTSRFRLTDLPPTLNGKRVECFRVGSFL